jgi:nicotinamide-nucleotide amidase
MSDALATALAAELGALLSARGWRVTTAESCTGGLVAGAITSVAGSSVWFDEGIVTYSDEAKQRRLGVPADTLAVSGAVSEPTARAMAEGALAAGGAHVAVAVTGIAGPGGGTPGKPVGLVWFAWARRGSEAATRACRFDGDRQQVRAASVVAALEGLIEIVREG